MSELAQQAAPVLEATRASNAPAEPVRRGFAPPEALIGNQARLRRLPAGTRLQPKLEIGRVDDPAEREADAAADKVMRMQDPGAIGRAPPKVSRVCADCEDETVRMAPDGSGGGDGGLAPPVVHEALGGSGAPLDPGARQFMEAGFGADFSGVRVHTDATAVRSAAAVGAHAYAVGQDLVFASGQYQPGTASGRHMLAHELAHTLQQGGGTIRRIVTTPSAGDAAEVTAHFNTFCPGNAVASGANVTKAAGACAAGGVSAGCDCACTAMEDPARTYSIQPKPCNVVMATETVGGTPTAVPESSVWPNTNGPPCGSPITIEIPKAGSAMEFGAFTATGSAFWYDTWRILAHEICGHGVGCQTYAGGTGNRPQHDATIDTENLIAAPPARGHFADRRQGEAFTNKTGDHSKVAFKQTDGWHYEAP